MEEKFSKITFIGDVTCDRPLLEASRIDSKKYDFSNVFIHGKKLFMKSDYVIANLETVCADSRNGYKNECFLLNSPDQIIEDIKAGGIDFVTTANNHCLDQGIGGLIRTIGVLDKVDIEHTGTFIDKRSREQHKCINVNGIKVAILAYTYGTNESNTGIILNDTNDYHVGLLRKQVDNALASRGVKKILAKHLSAKSRRTLKRIINRVKLRLGISYFKPYTDKICENDVNNTYLEQVKQEIAIAKQEADIVIVCPHMGGQFNVEPGEYARFLANFFKELKVDVIAGNHPHVVQKAYFDNGQVIAYSLGSYNLSLSADYIVHESLPEYSMALHIYINNESRKIEKATFSIFRIIENEKGEINVCPISELEKSKLTDEIYKNVTIIYNRITGQSKSNIEILEEYPL